MQLGASIRGHYRPRDPESWPSLAGAVDDLLKVDKGLGIEVWGSPSREQPMVAGQELGDLIDACQQAAFTTVHVQGRHWLWNPTTLRREIDFAHQLRAKSLILHPACFGLVEEEDRPDWPEILRIADYAAKFGVQLVMENTKDSMAVLDRILDEMGDDPATSNLGICIDIGHANQSVDAGRHPVINYLERYAGQLRHLHLHDNHGQDDEHATPGNGTVDWAGVLTTLDTIGFSGTAVVETIEPEIPAKESVKRSLAFLKQSGF